MTDCGHYTDVPVIRDEATLTVPAASEFRQVYVLRREGDSLPFDHIIVEKGAKCEICVISLPGVSVELPISVDLVGRGASAKLNGAYICGASERVNITTVVRHRVPECISNQLFNGVAGGSARAAFNGSIVVAPDAQKTEAYQVNRNIVISPAARVDTRPQLEIYADDVRCSHGATVGSLNEEEQFYMRSRGVPEAEARILQLISFISPVLTGFGDEALEEVQAAIRSVAL